MQSQPGAQAQVLQSEGGFEDQQVEVDLRRAGRQTVPWIVAVAGGGQVRRDNGLRRCARFGRLGDLRGRDVGGWGALDDLVEFGGGHFPRFTRFRFRFLFLFLLHGSLTSHAPCRVVELLISSWGGSTLACSPPSAQLVGQRPSCTHQEYHNLTLLYSISCPATTIGTCNISAISHLPSPKSTGSETPMKINVTSARARPRGNSVSI